MTDDERAALKRALTETGVKGADDLGRFVSNTEFFRPSEFDEKAAMPVLWMRFQPCPTRPWSSPSPVI